MPSREMLRQLRTTIDEACRLLNRTSDYIEKHFAATNFVVTSVAELRDMSVRLGETASKYAGKVIAGGQVEGETVGEENSTSSRGVHYLKCWPTFFHLVLEGKKPFEIRLNDRDFRIGDRVVLCEWVPPTLEDHKREAERYTGAQVSGEVTCVLNSTYFGTKAHLQEGYVVLGMRWELPG